MRLQWHYRVASTLFLFCSIASPKAATAQFLPDCNIVSLSAKEISKNSCGCTAQPKCNRCLSSGTSIHLASCTNGCEFCDANGTNCGTLQKQDIWGTTVLTFFGSVFTATIFDIEYTWTYTKGQNGTIVYGYRSDSFSGKYNCSATVNGQACASCQYLKCNNTNSSSREPTIDCTNLQAGATATACSGRRAGGPVSLDESALTGILAPLAYPYLLCQRGAVVLGTGAVTLPPSAAGPAPAPTTPSTPNTSNNNCGLLGLSIFCLNGCGLFGRILGLCRNE